MADAFTYDIYFAYTKKYIYETMDATTAEVVASGPITNESVDELKDYAPTIEWLDNPELYTAIQIGGSQELTASALVEQVTSKLINDSTFYRRAFKLRDSSNAITVDIFTTNGHSPIEFDASTVLSANTAYTFYIKEFQTPTVKAVKKYYTTKTNEIVVETDSETLDITIDVNDDSTGSFLLDTIIEISNNNYYPAYAQHNNFSPSLFGGQLPSFPSLFSEMGSDYHTNTNSSPYIRKLKHQVQENGILKYNISSIRDLDILNYIGCIVSEGSSFQGCYDIVYYPEKQVPTSLTVLYKLSSFDFDLPMYGGSTALNHFTEKTTSIETVFTTTNNVIGWPKSLSNLMIDGATVCMEGEPRINANNIDKSVFTRVWTLTFAVFPSGIKVSTTYDLGYTSDVVDIPVELNTSKKYSDYWPKTYNFKYTDENEEGKEVEVTTEGYLNALTVKGETIELTKLGELITFASLISYTGTGSDAQFDKPTALASYSETIPVKINYYGNSLYKLNNNEALYSASKVNYDGESKDYDKILIATETKNIKTDSDTLNSELKKALGWYVNDSGTWKENTPDVDSTSRIYFNQKDCDVESVTDSNVFIKKRRILEALRKNVKDVFHNFAEKETTILETPVSTLLNTLEGGISIDVYGDAYICKVFNSLDDPHCKPMRAVLYSSQDSRNNAFLPIIVDNEIHFVYYYKTQCKVKDMALEYFRNTKFKSTSGSAEIDISLCNYLRTKTTMNYGDYENGTIIDETITYNSDFITYKYLTVDYLKAIEYETITLDPKRGTGLYIDSEVEDGLAQCLRTEYDNYTWVHNPVFTTEYDARFPKSFLQNTTLKHLKNVTPILMVAESADLTEAYEDIRINTTNGMKFNLRTLKYGSNDLTNPAGYGLDELSNSGTTLPIVKTLDLTGIIGTHCIYGHLCSGDSGAKKLSSLLKNADAAKVPYLGNYAPERRGFFLAGVGAGGGGCGGLAGPFGRSEAGGGGAAGGFGCWYVDIDKVIEYCNDSLCTYDTLYIKSVGGQGGGPSGADAPAEPAFDWRAEGGNGGNLSIIIYYHKADGTEAQILTFSFSGGTGGYKNQWWWPDRPAGGKAELLSQGAYSACTKIITAQGAGGCLADSSWFSRDAWSSLPTDMPTDRLTLLATNGANFMGVALEDAYYGCTDTNLDGKRPTVIDMTKYEGQPFSYYTNLKPKFNATNTKITLLKAEDWLLKNLYNNTSCIGKTMDELFPGNVIQHEPADTKRAEWREGGYGGPSVCGFITTSMPRVTDDKEWSKHAPGKLTSSQPTAYNQYAKNPLPGVGGSGAGAGYIYTLRGNKYHYVEDARSGGHAFWGIFC